MKQIKYTTVALENNSYLQIISDASIVEYYCIGFTNNKRDKSLDGYYFKKELKPIK